MLRRRSPAPVEAPLLGRGWVLPRWLERQVDPDSAAYVGGGPAPVNVTQRSWTLLGTVGGERRAAVDPAGLVVTGPGAPALDWWIGIDDRWVFPSREPGLRQRLVDGAPVVETVMRVGGGEVCHRAYGAMSPDECLVIEIENRTKVAIAVAVAVRPYDLVGRVGVEQVELNGDRLLVEGEPLARVPRRPGAVIHGSRRLGDAALRLIGGSSELPAGEPCPAGLANLAVVFPLVHTGTLTLVCPDGDPGSVPGTERVVAGWSAQAERGARLVLPDDGLGQTLEAARRSLHLFEMGGRLVPDPTRPESVSAHELVVTAPAMARFGDAEVAGRGLLAAAEQQAADGHFGEGAAATGAVLGALGEHWRLTRDHDFAAAVAEPVARAVAWIETARRGQRRRRRSPADELAEGLMPAAGDSDEVSYLDSIWAIRGLRDAASILRAAHETEAASSASALSADLRVDLLASLERVAALWGTEAIPSGPARVPDETAVDSLAAVWPGAVLRPDHPAVTATLDVVRRSCHGPAYHNQIGPRGWGVVATARLAVVELLRGEPAALERLGWLRSVMSPTGAWPRSVHPRLGTGAQGPGHDGVAAAAVASAMRSLMVTEWTDNLTVSLALVPVWPAAWWGRDIEVVDLPTHAGRLGFALRWHGERPALLWELTPHEDLGAVIITAPGLDPAWSSRAERGETLLDPSSLGPFEPAPRRAQTSGPEASPGLAGSPTEVDEGGSFS